ncbi:chemotaxis protein CheW [Gorillibacterium timonense]|uniref:chemotaxis protein CheW n=1 Tax=Gorillibacterium timonense TaxID=1689269 RepID=UPI00071C884F|nr:chemotaxis protein CheW [Gorillibacterium timonense]
MHAAGTEQYIEFNMEEEKYAIPIHDINEIIKVQTITPLPNTRHYVKGVINLRGNIVPVVSLRSLFSFAEKEFTKLSRIVVVHHRAETVGVIVDRVNRVTTFSEIQPPPEQVGGRDGNLFTGIGLAPNGLIGILKLEQVLLHEQG